MKVLLDELHSAINKMLDNCNPDETPTICNLMSTREGRKKVFILVEKNVFQLNMTIGEAINNIDAEFDINSYIE
jgi:hypothetical protein